MAAPKPSKKLHFLKKIDLFGRPVSLNFDEKGTEYKTRAGGVCSILAIFIVFVYFLAEVIGEAGVPSADLTFENENIGLFIYVLENESQNQNITAEMAEAINPENDNFFKFVDFQFLGEDIEKNSTKCNFTGEIDFEVQPAIFCP